ncbi:MAG: hypothetical protein J6A95_06245 [Clostridia bacterium]|nr:hypothetical protein [Clostridia bacterium]
MSQEKLRKLHLIYGIVLSCIIIVTGICFIVSCVQIYNSGMRPFTRESIYTHFISIVVPVILCIVGIIGGMVLSFFPLEKQKIKGIIDTGVILNKMSKKIDISKCDSDTQEKIQKERKLRLFTNIFCIDALAVCIVISLIYALNKNNFPAVSINSEMVDAMLFILPCIIVGLGAIYATVLICNSSYSRELALVKKSLTTAKKVPVGDGALDAPNNRGNEKFLLGARLTLFVIAVTFIIIGIFNGGMADVLYKAINICTECIGLG